MAARSFKDSGNNPLSYPREKKKSQYLKACSSANKKKTVQAKAEYTRPAK